MGLCSCLASCLTWVIQHWSLLAIGWSWVLVLRWRSLGELLLIDIMGPGGLWWFSILNLALPSKRLRPDTRLEPQDPVSHMAQKKREKKRKKEKIK